MHNHSTSGISVAFLTPEWPVREVANGIATYVELIVGGLRRLGHRPCILSATGAGAGTVPDTYFLERESRPPLSRLLDPITFRIDSRQALRRRFAGNLRRAAQRAIAGHGVELLEMEETFGLLPLIKPPLKIPVVLRLHGPYFANGPAKRSETAPYEARVREEGDGIALADGVSAPAQEILERTRAHYGLHLKDAAVIPYPAPLVLHNERWRPADCDRKRILFIGRFDWHKGGDVVIDCLRQVLRTHPNVRLWFVGPDNGVVDDRGRSWRLDEYIARRAPEAAASIDWLGRQSRVAIDPLRRQAAVTLVASRHEVFGLVVLEAMAHGCPLVATRAGGIPEVLTDGVNGLLCRPGDPDDMAAKVVSLLDNPDLAARLGERAGEDAAGRYHPDRIARETAAFHRQILDRRTSP